MMEVGLRVVQGPDWQWANQDGGEGTLGTVVEIGKAGSPTSPDKTVVVQWDGGTRTNYRVGYQGAYDLRVWDNAPVGVKHQNIVCDSCKQQGISGMRWRCQKCHDFDLCTLCYMEDKHDLTHRFLRYETASSQGVEVPVRKGSVRLQLRGILPGARVVRGPDWDWGNQDGGEGKTGRVIDIRGWDNESGRSVANVVWSSGSTNVYRVGHKGKVDLRSVSPVVGGHYYRDHLPILGMTCDPQVRQPRGPGSPQTITSFSVGDKVKVIVDVKTLKELQEGHGGWNPRMVEYIGQVGTVHRVTDRGDIRVQFDGCNQRWTFHPRALCRLAAFSAGDTVRISDDMLRVKELQRGHGEWIDAMRTALGKIGKVTKVYPDGDLRVSVDGHTWTLNPLCLTPLPGSATELHNTMAASVRQEHTNPLASLLSHLLVNGNQPAGTGTASQQPAPHPASSSGAPGVPESSTADRLVREAAQGHTDVVQDLLIRFPDKVDARSSGKTCLQVAAHQGHLELVSVLLLRGAALEVADDDGDTALHYAAFGNQPEVMELLIQRGAKVDSTNKGRCTPLHVAVNKQFPGCVRMLLRYNCNVNIQDSYGDTALHDAIGKENTDIVEMLAAAPGVDFTLRNKRGFNVLHHAALKGNTAAAERILQRSRQLVDVRKDDGFAALHLASLNGHLQMAQLLLTNGHSSVDPLNNRRQTPLLLAVSQGHAALVELLVSFGADVNVADEDGDTGIHVACLKLHALPGEAPAASAPNIHAIQQQLHSQGRDRSSSLALAIACYLVQKGCDPLRVNRKAKTAADIIADQSVGELLLSFVPQSVPAATAAAEEAAQPLEVAEEATETAIVEAAAAAAALEMRECIVCCEAPPDVAFQPCGHLIACGECAQRMKKCLQCHMTITHKEKSDGTVVSLCTNAVPSTDRVRFLESRIAEIEEAYTCSICMERRRNVAFLCGHGACDVCSRTLRTCHMCRKLITRKINLY